MIPALLLACAQSPPTPTPAPPAQPLQLTAALQPDALCGGGSPAVTWSGLPEGTGSIALTLVRPGQQGPWVHWMAWDIPPDWSGLPAGIRPTTAPPTQGIGSNNTVGYAAPCPQDEARYVLRAFALPAPLGLPPTTDWTQLGAAIQDNALTWGRLDLSVPGGEEPDEDR